MAQKIAKLEGKKNAALKNFLWASKKSSQAEKQTERSLKKEEGKNRGLKRLEFKV